MKVIMQCYGATLGFGDPLNYDCEYAVFEVTDSLLELIRKRGEAAQAAKRADESFYSTDFWDYSITVYDWSIHMAVEDLLDSDQFIEFEDNQWGLLPEGIDLEKLEWQRIECSLMQVSTPSVDGAFYFNWGFIPKHSGGFRVDTAQIPFESLLELLKGEQVAS